MKITIQDNKTSVTVQPRDFKVTVSGARGPAGPSEWGGIDGDIEDQTDLYNALQARVPYTGATADVNLGEYGAQLGNLEFDNTPTNVPTAAGSVYWSDTDGTLNMVLKGGQTISRIGETQHIRALNNTGAQIARGKVVYVVGAQGQRLTIALADADTEILSKDTIGFTSEAIADGAEGFVIVQGVINNISTTGMTDGATVYLSQTAGGYTTTPPADPAHLVILGFIVNGGSGGAGSIYVKVDNGYELEELHNVSNSAKTTPVGDDALFLRDSADNNLWKRLTWTNALAGVKTHMDTFKSVAGGYASLDGSGKVPSNELPSYVDDVVEVANYAALPVTGETGKIYVTLDTNKCYRWSGTVYVQVAQGVDTLTTTGTSGAATLVGSTLNIPQYQSVLTNPVTGTGTAGQVSYWSGTGTQTGSAELTWDNVNKRLGAGVTTPLYGIHHVGTAGAAGIVSVRDFTFNAIAQISQRASFVGYVTDASRGVAFGAVAAGGSLQSFANLPATAASNLILQPYGGDVSLGFATAPSARLHVRGSGTTSSTTALLVQNSTPSALLTILDNGSTTISGSTTAASALARGVNITSTLVAAANNDVLVGLDITPTYTVGGFTGVTRYDIRTSGSSLLGTSISFTNFSNISTSGLSQSNSSLIIRGGQGSAVGNINLINFQSNNPITSTSNNPFLLGTFISFEPTSGNANFGIFNIAGTINQTGGANGITRGLYVNPTLTAAADWRSIEWSNNTGWGLYGAGTAANYLAGNTSIGTTTRSGRLTVRGETTTSASNGLLVEDSAGTDTFTVRNDGGYAFKGGTVGVAQTGYTTFTNLVTDRTCDANATTVEELADILGTLIEDLKTKGIISA